MIKVSADCRPVCVQICWLMKSRSNRKNVFILMLVLAVVAGLVIIQLRRPPSPSLIRNVVLISIDTCRADYLSCYDPSHSRTPNLDSLAESGLLFENCFSQIPITLPAHAAIFFSRQPDELHVYNNGVAMEEQPLSPSVAEIFQKEGYATAAFVSMAVLKATYGLDRGFGEYHGDLPQNGRFYYTAKEVNSSVFPWLEQNSERDFFLWLHYSDPHAPYHPPDLRSQAAISLNGDKLGDYALSGTVYSVELDLRSGSNTLEFDVTNPGRTNPDRRHVKVRQFELSKAEGAADVTWEQGEGCLDGPEGSLFSCIQKAHVRLINSGAAARVALTFQLFHSLPPERRREMYRDEVEYLDSQLGRLFKKLAALKLDAKTHILVVGDHGESLGEYPTKQGRPHFGHIHYLYDAYLRVPLIIRPAGSESRKGRIDAPVSLLDIAPSLLSLAGIRPNRQYSGTDLLDAKIPARRDIIQATYKPEADKNRFAILSFPWHLLFSPEDQTYELYNLETDPEETTDIYPQRAGEEAVRQMRLRLETATRDILINRPVHEVDDATEKMLRALGYIK